MLQGSDMHTEQLRTFPAESKNYTAEETSTQARPTTHLCSGEIIKTAQQILGKIKN